MSEFCRRDVEPMGVECDHVQISAITEYLSVSVEIIYLDRNVSSESGYVRVVKFPMNSDVCLAAEDHDPFPPVTLLYRPGHYDILYAE